MKFYSGLAYILCISKKDDGQSQIHNYHSDLRDFSNPQIYSEEMSDNWK